MGQGCDATTHVTRLGLQLRVIICSLKRFACRLEVIMLAASLVITHSVLELSIPCSCLAYVCVDYTCHDKQLGNVHDHSTCKWQVLFVPAFLAYSSQATP